eukprot:501349-Amphidinium_carterae.1
MIAERTLLEAQIKEIQSKLMADVVQYPASPATVATRITDECSAALALTPEQRAQMLHILNTLNYADPPAP